eukprot:SAG31_NODE_26590_length_439_cov_3.129412_2_plen_75_part_01
MLVPFAALLAHLAAAAPLAGPETTAASADRVAHVAQQLRSDATAAAALRLVGVGVGVGDEDATSGHDAPAAEQAL